MAEARQRSDWARTSSLMALLANAHRDAKRTRAFKPSDFDPFARSESNTNDIAGLRAIFQTNKQMLGSIEKDQERQHAES